MIRIGLNRTGACGDLSGELQPARRFAQNGAGSLGTFLTRLFSVRSSC